MRTSRRFIAIVAAFAVAFGALWPLVSSAMPRSAGFPSFICTQSGFQHPGDPANHDDKFHCPLCVTSVDSAPPALAPAVALVLPLGAAAVVDFESSSKPYRGALSPPSRAPPILP